MKKIIFLFFPILIISCKKDSKPNSNNPPATTKVSSFSYEVDGKTFSATNDLSYVVNGGVTLIRVSLHLSDSSDVNGEVFLQIANPKQGSFVLNLTSGSIAIYSGPDNLSGTSASCFQINDTTLKFSSGLVKITKFDTENKKVSGEFLFDICDNYLGKVFYIRNGKFTDVPFQY